METNFSLEQLRDDGLAEAEKILRTCVHCGFCTATCPTYVLMGDELDSPRGRIYQIKDMLENDKPAGPQLVKHVDRCLSCLACMSTCPSGVHYMHLVDHARAHINRTYKRPFADRLIRIILQTVLPYPSRFRFALLGAKLGKPFAGLIKAVAGSSQLGKRLGAMLALAPGRIEGPNTHSLPGSFPAIGESKIKTDAPKDKDGEPRKRLSKRVALLTGCAQPVLDSGINGATIELLNRLGYEVVLAQGEGCCGALVHHMGEEDQAHTQARANIEAWSREIDAGGLDAILITTSGCGTTVKDYGYMFRNDPLLKDKAAIVSDLARDISQFLEEINLPKPEKKLPRLTVAYHSACSLQHGQQVKTAPKTLLSRAGLRVKDVPEGHLCCGSAGVYNIMQPDIAGQLRDRKVANIDKTKPDLIAAGNIGCITQIGSGTEIPIIHTVELLNWAYGGEKPEKLKERS
ncbi:MAG: heterodisulfide reductase-related iron-sulfur binding cluster [Cohaesibacter sp.]|jgi:glycolate oxidase iron-sulfur subunit|nr:heterodisulfide reductase-related iron-sulfur binding cluster [Cohaesibacter sp.]